jgi:two-component system LytT family response regulator
MRRARREILGDDVSSVTKSLPIVVRNGEALISLLPEDIVWVGAANQYVELHTRGDGEYVVSQSLRQFSRELPGGSFVRIHRSTLINPRHIVAVLNSDGRYRVQMRDGSTHDIARNRRPLVASLLASAHENSNA